MIRQLMIMRQQQEQRLVRVDNGEKELDRQGADLMLKVRAYSHGNLHYLLHYPPIPTDHASRVFQICAAESKERVLLEQQQGKGKRD